MTDRTINCPIHGVINLTPRMCSIIDTPEFQRLHRLRQLGVTHFVYPSATHTRFEHSIGVSHLAKIVLISIQNKHPELKIDDNLIELYQVGALLHDIGHGPFSHLYDDEIINPEEVHHEDRGISIFKNMVEKYNLSFNKRFSLRLTPVYTFFKIWTLKLTTTSNQKALKLSLSPIA